MAALLRIGTRGSKLALTQAEQVKTKLQEKFPELAAEGAIETVIIKTSGDRIRDRALRDVGGKELFTKEIEEALSAKEIDCAVHSMKDVGTTLPEGLIFPALLPRESAADALITTTGIALKDLPQGAKIGTASLRRAALLRAFRPDFEVVLFRGNVGTRLEKLKNGEADATLLAVSGLNRLNLSHVITEYLDPVDFTPAAGQGAIGVQIRADDEKMNKYVTALNCQDTMDAVGAERSFLAALNGSCHTPIGAWARVVNDNTLMFRGFVGEMDGSHLYRSEMVLTRPNGWKESYQAGLDLKAELPESLLATLDQEKA